MNLQNRTELAKWLGERGYKKGAEIGVADGRYSEILCQNIDGIDLTCIDPWAPYEGNWRNTGYQNRAFKQASERLKGYNATLVRKTGLEASLDIPDRSLDFVFIDGDHCFDATMIDVILWSKKVKKRGIVAGHDYCYFKDSGVVEAVNKYTEIHKLELNLIGRNESEHRDDRQPCWWFVNRR